jgi:hypothetical protein
VLLGETDDFPATHHDGAETSRPIAHSTGLVRKAVCLRRG